MHVSYSPKINPWLFTEVSQRGLVVYSPLEKEQSKTLYIPSHLAPSGLSHGPLSVETVTFSIFFLEQVCEWCFCLTFPEHPDSLVWTSMAAASHGISPSVEGGPPVTTHRHIIHHKHIWRSWDCSCLIFLCFNVTLTLCEWVCALKGLQTCKKNETLWGVFLPQVNPKPLSCPE